MSLGSTELGTCRRRRFFFGAADPSVEHLLSPLSFIYFTMFLVQYGIFVVDESQCQRDNKGEKGSIEGKRFISLEINTSLDRDNQTITKCFLVCCL